LASGAISAKNERMNIVVCAKQIPDPAEPGALDPQTKTLKRDGKLILDESDMYGVEMALQLAEAAGAAHAAARGWLREVRGMAAASRLSVQER
jgi:electron transfer flavoprotein beta subunit